MRLALRGRSLFSRVFLHGLLVLIASAATFVGLSALLIKPELDRQLLDFGRWAGPHICSQMDASGAKLFPPGGLAAMYDTHGTLLASTMQPPLPPLSDALVRELRSKGGVIVSGARVLHAFWCGGGEDGTYVQIGPPRLPLQGLLLPLAMAVLVVALASLPLARSIARPLAALVGATQAFGDGKLDVRTEVRRSDEVGDLGRAFNGMASRLQRVIRAEQELLANVSHELRTPLARMRVVLETAEENPRRAAPMLREIGRDLHDLERLVESVTETMRVGMTTQTLPAHKLPARFEAVDVMACLSAARERFLALYPERALRLEGPEGALLVRADPRLVQRLLDNLLDNARKYAGSTAPIVLRGARDAAGAYACIEVIDRGEGIDEGELARVREPFYRGERSRATAPGAGLGLALVQRIVDVHDGKVVIDSQVGVGTTVRVALPLA